MIDNDPSSYCDQIHNAVKMLAGGVVWSCLGAFFGTMLELCAARAKSRKMSFIDLLIAYVLAFLSGTMVWIYVLGIDVEETTRAYLTMGGCLFGREVGPLFKESVIRIFRK